MDPYRLVLDLRQEGFPDSDKLIQLPDTMIIGGLAGAPGEEPTVAVAIEREGRWLTKTAPLSLLLNITDALKAQYGDPRQ